MSGGVSRLVAAEFLAAALGQTYQGPIIILFLGDYDPGDWLAGRVFAEYLARYNFPWPNGPQYLVRPQLFSAQELKLRGCSPSAVVKSNSASLGRPNPK